MEQNEFYEKLKEYALNNENYIMWRKDHTKVFGKLFSQAFSENTDGQICLTAALINISGRNFEGAKPMLDNLEAICHSEFDSAVICYFKGLNFEFMGKEDKMTENYEKFRQFDIPVGVGYFFHPYYRTAKLAQKSSECSKAIYYYKKALEFFESKSPRGNDAVVVGQIMYDLATVFLYMHEYEQCERFIDIACQYNKSNNPQLDYVKAILYAVQGKKNESDALTDKMIELLKVSCRGMTAAILSGQDLHYCTVLQDRSSYPSFWEWVVKNEGEIVRAVISGNIVQAENMISQKLTGTFAFVRRSLECGIEYNGGKIIVKCKNYRIKTLKEEYKALLDMRPQAFTGIEFVSVDEFELF